ncbi:DNA helicase [Sporosarcina sp. P21c]|uniref:DEAD/DEAH box helicase n=1 Tax=unclassified Sporosarcina TaxID=2647733 RepID=UPI000C171DE8|nr:MULTISPECIES: AAA domain-containing protein [unclassified Sporosarcina]PIC66319.1 DNA helicase [Sporosarcina sp. P16a]PIC89202.1 DNA helicase [Sporosarcina sp. P21c]PIC92271.1 DNA helicase [Sporosarcina sp. P25]
MSVLHNIEKILCSLDITKNARKGLEQWFISEEAFVSSESVFDIHIEKKPENRMGNQSYALFFDPHTNKRFAKEVQQRVAVMECVLKPDGLLATGFHVRSAREPVQTNRRLHTAIKFKLHRAGVALPIEFYTQLRQLPIAEERSEYVKKRIESWEGYLQIAEKNADVADISCTFSQASFTSDFTKVRLQCNDLQMKNWKQLRGFSVKMNELSTEIGQVIDAQKGQKILVVELNQRFQKKARSEQWLPTHNKSMVLTNFAELSQIRRLRKGFKDLQDGLAANANLEKILFEERPVVQITNKQPQLEFHNNLNEFQREAVSGAMKAHDLFVVQGPPGTGKTTVISEICYQNVKAGLRTLVASQSNLAVDNALGRLLTDPATRILRYGRSESIEEEGKRFMEENVALHWRNETLETVQATRAVYRTKDTELQKHADQLSEEIRKNTEMKITLTEQLQSQKIVQEELKKLKSEYFSRKSLLDQSVRRLSQKQQGLEQTEIALAQRIKEIIELRKQLNSEPNKEELTARVEELLKEQRLLKETQIYLNWLAELQSNTETQQMIIEEHKTLPDSEQKLQATHRDVMSQTKMKDIQMTLTARQIELPIHITLRNNDLQRIIKSIESGEYSYEFQEWKELHERFQTAIKKTQTLLQAHRYPVETIMKRSTDNFTTIQEMHEMIDRLGKFLIHPATKKMLENKEISSGKTEVLQKIAQGMSLFYGKEEVVRAKGIELQQQKVHSVKEVFAEVKHEILRFLQQELQEIQNHIQRIEKQKQQLQSRQNELEKQIEEWLQTNELPEKQWEKNLLTQEIDQLETKLNECRQQIKNVTQLSASMTTSELKCSQEKQLLEQEKVEVLAVEQKTLQLQEEQNQRQQEIEELTVQLKPDIKEQLEKIEIALGQAETQQAEVIKEQQQLPVLQELQSQWEELLRGANEYDLDEIRKLYIDHANVIGTTCVASASKKFMDEYPVFDVVIIDEVSKATPPELLLPMLKGKKVILVGDHHQLPPLVGQETMDELVDQQKDPEVQREMKKMLNESLFERLFRTLPKQNKTMLSIQYRMHEKIMETIAPFYKDGDYQLQCGLPNSDELRDHLLESSKITRKDHLLWLDMPNTPSFFEEQVKGGTSRFNEAELTVIQDTLLDIEQATEKAKKDGLMKPEEKKSVGVISFYGEQVKRIDRLIQQEIRPKQLHCRTGSVDKFQGMEMDIIILSFVRNHGEKNGDIGFAKDYRRLNVALSRARELLIIVGSSEMFTVKTKNASTRDMYKQLREVVEHQGGLRKIDQMQGG